MYLGKVFRLYLKIGLKWIAHCESDFCLHRHDTLVYIIANCFYNEIINIYITHIVRGFIRGYNLYGRQINYCKARLWSALQICKYTILIRSHSFGSYRIGKVVWQSDWITIEIIKNHFSLFSIINDKTAYDKTSLDKLA